MFGGQPHQLRMKRGIVHISSTEQMLRKKTAQSTQQRNEPSFSDYELTRSRLLVQGDILNTQGMLEALENVFC